MPCNAQVLLKYHHKYFNVGWGITNTPWHIYRMLTQFANFLEVGILTLSSTLTWIQP